MRVTDFIEISNPEERLYEYQKQIIRMYESLPEGAKLRTELYRRKPARTYAIKDGVEYSFDGENWIPITTERDENPMKKALPLITAMHSTVTAGLDGPKKKFRAKPEKNCLECGKKHTHNNSYCSAKCCKAHRAKDNERL